MSQSPVEVPAVELPLRTRVEAARAAALRLALLSLQARNAALERVAASLVRHRDAVFAANRRDLAQADAEAIAPALRKRLVFDQSKLDEVVAGIRALVALPDPLGVRLAGTELDAGLRLYRVTVPIGVIGVVFESRPDALVQISCLCLKSGNAVLLKGGREAAETNRQLGAIIADAAGCTENAGCTGSHATQPPDGWIQLLASRNDVREILAYHDLIDLIIPRGSNQFVADVMANTSIPIMGHADGICHAYVHGDIGAPTATATATATDVLNMVVEVIIDSKLQYSAVCNAVETVLVHEAAAVALLPVLVAALVSAGCEVRGCPRVRAIVDCREAVADDWSTEYLAPIVSIKVVQDFESAVAHINHYGSHHTDVILTQDQSAAEQFMAAVDSAGVFWNCSTRFADGYRYGLGAEVGVSTGKLHARGPVGLDGLTTYKWQLFGSGQRVADYTGPQARPFLHRPLV